MKKTARKLMALLLSLVMLLSLGSVSAFAATADNVVQYGTYTSLGDSAVAGYGLQDWDAMKLRYGKPRGEQLNAEATKAAIETINLLNLTNSIQGNTENILVKGTAEYASALDTFATLKLGELSTTLSPEELAEVVPVDFTRLHEVYGTYASTLAQAVGASESAGTFHHYAQCAFRTEELRMVLDPSYKGDSEELVNMAASLSNGSFDYDNLLELQANGTYIDAIKNSNLVTMSIGANDIYVPILCTVISDLTKALMEAALAEGANTETTQETAEAEAEQQIVDVFNGDAPEGVLEQSLEAADPDVLMEETNEEDVNNTAENVIDNIDANDEGSVMQVIGTLVALLTAKNPLYPAKLLKLAVQCELNYRINYTAIVNKIFEINPNVTLIAPTYTMNYDGMGDFGNILKLVFGEMNLFVKARSTYNGHFQTVTLPDSKLSFSDISHPDEAGHAVIAETILKALPAQDSVKGTTVKQGANGSWYAYTNGIYNPTLTSVEKNAFGWWYVKDGKVDFTFNGIAQNANGWWYITGGKVNFLKTGFVKVDSNNKLSLKGTTYKVVAGKVQKK